MLTREKIEAYPKEELPEIALTLEKDDIPQLIDWLSEKDDKIRYPSFLLLQARSENFNDVYPYWDAFVEKLEDPNSFKRNIGLRLIAANVRWDKQGKFDAVCDRFLARCDDEKPVTVRQCIQSLCGVVPFNTSCRAKIVDHLMSLDIPHYRESQQKLILLDILSVLLIINKESPDKAIMAYIQQALTGGLLDKKSKTMIEAQL